jgi:hypothetical protein
MNVMMMMMMMIIIIIIIINGAQTILNKTGIVGIMLPGDAFANCSCLIG